ncbi:hypothetical protein B0H17DRAFT_1126873 [Mycena rosella]|uniref:Uncharacterized protein n=1 Tax=Mycena rosella TaxID=1033263 RepID=A0AAD7GT12_MYCRO|nr:hypothetical protein B0H17DRAFT_1126873 [Mycena rosella]
MVSPFCRCGNPNACTCFAQTPPRSDFYHNTFASASPQAAWTPTPQPQYYPPMPPQAFTPTPAFNTGLPFLRDFMFHHFSPATFNSTTPAPAPSSAARAPLGNATNTVNSSTALQLRRKRKRGAPAEPAARTRRHVDSGAALDGPAVFGVGPSSAAGICAATLKASQDIRRFLQVPHIVQEIVSAEKTPTLSLVLPMYEKLILYLGMSRRTRMYALTMVLNLTIKLQWLCENWSAEDAVAAKIAIRAAMLEYRKEHRSQTSRPSVQLPATTTRRAVNPLSASRAARAQSSGFACLNALAKSLSGFDLDSARDSPPADELTEQEKAEAEHRAVAEDERIVDEELEKYEGQGVVDESNPEFEDLDLLRYWEGRINFWDGSVATEEEISVIDIDPEVIDDLLSAGRTQELGELVNSSWASAPA